MRRSLDGVSPVRSSSAPRRRQSYAPNPGTGRSIDGIKKPSRPIRLPQQVERAWQARPRVGFDTPEFIKNPTIDGKPHTTSSRIRGLLALLQYPLIAVIAVVMIYSTLIGQWAVVAYALYAIIRGIDSKYSFIVALILLVAIPIFQLIGQPGVSENVALYAYLMLVAGTLQAVVELIKDARHKKKHDTIDISTSK